MTFESLVNLKHFDFDRNELKEIELLIFNGLNIIETINLQDNQFKSIPHTY